MRCAATDPTRSPAVVDVSAIDHMSALTSALRRANNESLPDQEVSAMRLFVEQCHRFIERGVPCGVGTKRQLSQTERLALQAFIEHAAWARHPEAAELLKPLFVAYVRAGVIKVHQHPNAPRHPSTGRLMHWHPLEQAVIGFSADTMVALLECGADPTELGEDGDAAGFIRANQTEREALATTATFRETVMRLRLQSPTPPESAAPRRRLGV